MDLVVIIYLINMLQKLIKYIFINKSINIPLPINVIDFKFKQIYKLSLIYLFIIYKIKLIN